MFMSYDKLMCMSEKSFTPYKILNSPAYGEYEEKKSKFLAYMQYVDTEEDAIAFINSIKKKHYDARHNCSAFIIGSAGEITRSSDDGEPSGTAGKPMLEVINGANLKNIVVVVTRYFGGVLLGTGGLVRAYSQAVKNALADAKIAEMTYSSDIEATVSYTDSNSIRYYIDSNGISVIDTIYSDVVKFCIRVPFEQTEEVIGKLTEFTQGKASIEITSKGFNPL